MEITCVADTKSALGEGATWDAGRGWLWWVDIYGHLVHAFVPASGENKTWEIGERVSFAVPRVSGGLILTTESGIYSFDPDTGAKAELHNPEPNLPGNRFNDAGTDRQGRLWAGTMRDDGIKKEPVGSFYRMDADLTLTRMFEGFYTTNGLAFSPDGTRMYLAETHKDVRTIWSCAYDTATGTPGERHVFVDTHEMAGRPDGGTVDAEGYYWMAGVGGWQVVRFDPNGAVDRIIDVPVQMPTKPMFGGPDLDTLYVTSLSQSLDPERSQPQAGSLFAITGLGVSGIKETPFAG